MRTKTALPSQVHAILRTGLAVSVLHDVHYRLMPPVQHDHCQDMPHLVTGAEVVQLSCREQKGQAVKLVSLALTHSMQAVSSEARYTSTLSWLGGSVNSLTNLIRRCLISFDANTHKASLCVRTQGRKSSTCSLNKFGTHSQD